MNPLKSKHAAYCADFSLLHFLQSIWQLSSLVLPPSDQGVIWSASLSLIVNLSVHQYIYLTVFYRPFWYAAQPLRLKYRLASDNQVPA